MFKLTQLLNRGRQVKELKEIQKEKERIQEELNKCALFPDCSYKIRKLNRIDTFDELADILTLVFLGRMPFETINQYCGNYFNLKEKETQDYFNELGNYFLSLSGNLEVRQSLENKLEKLCEKERKLKEKLGIK